MTTTTEQGTHIVSSSMSLLISGLSSKPTSLPMVSLSQKDDIENGYHLVMHMYLQDGTTPNLSSYLNDIVQMSTQAGNLALRNFETSFMSNGGGGALTTLSLWELEVVYQVVGLEAEGVYVLSPALEIADPGTIRGTVTIVTTT